MTKITNATKPNGLVCVSFCATHSASLVPLAIEPEMQRQRRTMPAAAKASPNETGHGEGMMTVCAEVSGQNAVAAVGHALTASPRRGIALREGFR